MPPYMRQTGITHAEGIQPWRGDVGCSQNHSINLTWLNGSQENKRETNEKGIRQRELRQQDPGSCWPQQGGIRATSSPGRWWRHCCGHQH